MPLKLYQEDESGFTFHSGYILMVGYLEKGSIAHIFTFHSGYILIRQRGNLYSTPETLHSILDIF